LTVGYTYSSNLILRGIAMIGRTQCLAIAAIALLLSVNGVSEAALVTPTGVTATGWWDSSVHPSNLINGSALSLNSPAGTHGNHFLAETMWFAGLGPGTGGGAPIVANQEVVFDLGGTYDLAQAHIWQMNQGHAVNNTGQRNTRTMDIYVSPDNVTYTQVAGTRTLGVANGSNSALPAETVSLSASNVRYVKFDILTAGSGLANEYVGLSEVRFQSVNTGVFFSEDFEGTGLADGFGRHCGMKRRSKDRRHPLIDVMYQGVVFDMDGTLIEPLLDFARLRGELGIAAGMGIIEALDTMDPAEAAPRRKQLLAREMQAARKAALHPGAIETIETIRAAGLKTALLTRNAAEAMAVVLERFDLNFDLAWSRDDGPIKPEPDGILRACRQLDIAPAATACVGDFRYDMLAANAAGAVGIALARSGECDFADLARHVITELDQLPALLGI